MLTKEFSICLPATSANLGTGFDSFGIALNIFNTFTFKESSSFSFNCEGYGKDLLADVENNLFILSYKYTVDKLGKNIKPIEIQAQNNLPLQGGMGSSATAIIAGIIAAFLIHGLDYSDVDILKLALHFEDHIDNLVPCLIGGFTITSLEGTEPFFIKHEVKEELVCLIIYPHIEVSTSASRKKLASNFSIQDLNHQVAKSSFVVSSFVRNEWSKLKIGLDDKIHESQRYPEQVEYSNLKNKLYASLDVYGFCVSGSGPSLILFCTKRSAEIDRIINDHFENVNIEFDVFETNVSNQGVKIQKNF